MSELVDRFFDMVRIGIQDGFEEGKGVIIYSTVVQDRFERSNHSSQYAVRNPVHHVDEESKMRIQVPCPGKIPHSLGECRLEIRPGRKVRRATIGQLRNDIGSHAGPDVTRGQDSTRASVLGRQPVGDALGDFLEVVVEVPDPDL